MTLTTWLQYLETLPSGLSNNSLASVKSVAQKLDILKFPGKIVTIGGTNGKGSCVAFLESILLAAGYKTGSFMSPHVLSYNERIRLDGKNIDDQTLCEAFAQIESARAGITLSYFEYSTLAALLIFKKQKLDVLILEVGLGGKFDAVNILDADIAVITTISLDHTKVLGNTREAIGREKAGIMRPFKPIICGDPNIPKSIYAETNKIKAILYCANRDFSYSEQHKAWSWQFAQNTMKKLPLLKLPIANAATALMAIKLLQLDLEIPKKAIITGLKNAFLTGRWQCIIFGNREIIFDVAHNQEAAALLAQKLIKNPSKGRILAVMSMFGDKNITATVKPLTKIIDKWYLGILVNTRAASAKELEQSLKNAGITNFVSLPDIAKALQQAIAECQRRDRIVVFGSFHTVAAGLKIVAKSLKKGE